MVVLVTVVNEVVVSAALVVSVTAPCFGDVDDVYHYHVKNNDHIMITSRFTCCALFRRTRYGCSCRRCLCRWKFLHKISSNIQGVFFTVLP